MTKVLLVFLCGETARLAVLSRFSRQCPQQLLNHVANQASRLHGVKGLLLNYVDCLALNLDIVELYSGVASMHRTAIDCSLQSRAVDKHRVKRVTEFPGSLNEEVCTLDGFEKPIRCVLRIRPGGLIIFSPKCKSFVAASAPVYKRKGCTNWRGDEGNAAVQEGNSIANARAVLMLSAFERGLSVVVENTFSSQIWHYPETKQAIQEGKACSSAIGPRCAYDDARDGKRFGALKRTCQMRQAVCTARQDRPSVTQFGKCVGAASRNCWFCPILPQAAWSCNGGRVAPSS